MIADMYADSMLRMLPISMYRMIIHNIKLEKLGTIHTVLEVYNSTGMNVIWYLYVYELNHHKPSPSTLLIWKVAVKTLAFTLVTPKPNHQVDHLKYSLSPTLLMAKMLTICKPTFPTKNQCVYTQDTMYTQQTESFGVQAKVYIPHANVCKPQEVVQWKEYMTRLFPDCFTGLGRFSG